MTDRNVVYLGLSGFPNGLAMISKVKIISKALQLKGRTVCVLNRKRIDDNILSGKSENIIFDTVSRIKKSKSFIKRRISNILFPFKEWRSIVQKIKEFESKYLFVNSRSFSQLLLYYLLSKIYKQTLVITYVEYGKAMVTKSRIMKLNDVLFEQFAFKMVDGALPISDFLLDIVKKRNSRLPILKTPVLTDVNRIKNITVGNVEDRFLFCGAAAFIEVIEIIIDSFCLVKGRNTKLTLICGGTQKEIRKLEMLISKSVKQDKIELLYDLDYNELIRMYKTALALLIPLRPTIQDIARFPHKIGEYAAAARPIITNNYGESANYFKDEKSALLANEYTPECIAEKMNFVIANKERANEIGLKGQEIAKKYFDYITYSDSLELFLKKIEK